MNKFIAIAAAAVMIATPVVAHDYNRGYNNYPRYEQRHNRYGSGAVIAGVVGGAILGAIITQNQRPQAPGYRQPQYPHYPQTPQCYVEPRKDYFGNVYYEKICR